MISPFRFPEYISGNSIKTGFDPNRVILKWDCFCGFLRTYDQHRKEENIIFLYYHVQHPYKTFSA